MSRNRGTQHLRQQPTANQREPLNNYMRRYRKGWSNTQKENNRVLSRIRMRKMRLQKVTQNSNRKKY